MRVPLEWLREYCDPPLQVAEIEERLTMTGTKVEAVERFGAPDPAGFVIGRVLSAEPHPDADRLRVCTVDLGEGGPGGPATIVCGAPNVAADQTVAVARPGAVMPDGTKLRRAKLRGVESEGMILAEDELGIGSEHTGIMVLDGSRSAHGEDLLPGAPLSEAVAFATDVLELEVTPNRPDCLGVYGVARELHAATGAPLAPEPWREDPGTWDGVDGVEVEVLCPDLCPRFTARLFEDVRIGPSPPWLKARLMAAGQRPINNVVDITNYVMLLTGQPLHAFDWDRVAGGRLEVRRAREGEEVRTLDGETRRLDGEMVLISDREGPTSIAGLMGGERSEVGAETSRVLIEVATWDGPNIHRSGWALGLRSEASARFEKGLEPESCAHAQALASRLMVELCSARAVPGTIDVWAASGAGSGQDGAAQGVAGSAASTGGAGGPPQTIRLRSAKVRAVLGMEVAGERQGEILEALGFGVQQAGEDLDVTVPPLRRRDVSRECDLIEEVARIAGLDQIPTTLPARRGAYGMLSAEQRLRRRAVDALVGCGLSEVMGWTFTSPAALGALCLDERDRRGRAVALANPLSEEHSLLRTTLLGSLRAIAQHNLARGARDFGIFEVGTVFAHGGDDVGGPDGPAFPSGPERDGSRAGAVSERRMLGVMLCGASRPATWRERDAGAADLFAIKGVLEALAQALGVSVRCEAAAPASHPFLHPGRAAEVFTGSSAAPIGWLGELHPLVGGEELAGAPALELDLGALLGAAAGVRHTFRAIPTHPPLERDLAVSIPAELTAARVLAAIREAARESGLLEDVRVFDVYSGSQVGEGRRSLALALRFCAAGRTLSEEEVAPIWRDMVSAVQELGGELRA
ncbi:MAG: phenylalanine--tRNA ligase subunit beta [Acidobacteriota bacterium]|nr:phenylalanine--tRNA ligase subunit beta [Acidobacteriota bacterium]